MIIFSPGTTETCIDITINDDLILEAFESFSVSLESAGDPSIEIGPLPSTTVMILDNDGMSRYNSHSILYSVTDITFTWSVVL